MNNIYYIIQRIKSLRFSVSVFILLNLGTSLYSQTLEEQCREKIQILQTLMQQAETKGINTLKEQLAIRTAEVFLDFAAWDENHIAENESYFKMVTPYKNNALQMAQDLSGFEREDISFLLDKSIEYIKLLIDGKFLRKDIPIIDWKGVFQEGDQLTYNNRPVFLEDYTWKPSINKLNEFYGSLDGFYIAPNHVINENGDIRSNIVSQLQSKVDGTPGNIFIAHKTLPQWAIDKYGEEITKHKGEPFFLYDIDNPGAKDVISKLIKGTVPLMAGKNYTKLGYMLANEPRWLNYKDGTNKVWYQGTVSDYTIEKFKSFLKEKHQTIERLNEVWGTAFTGFDAVTFQIPIDISKMGTPQWYDYATFNDARVLEWFLFMKNEIVSCDPEAKVHLKIMPSFFTENLACSGIDLEALTEMSEIIGNDIAAHYNNIHNEVEWDNR